MKKRAGFIVFDHAIVEELLPHVAFVANCEVASLGTPICTFSDERGHHYEVALPEEVTA